MSLIEQIVANKILMAGIYSWLIAQILKTILYAWVNREMDWHRLLGDGGMPSGHSATVTAVALTSGFQCGFQSPEFAISCIVAIVVMHDAMGVRLETGKQAKVLNEMMQILADLGQPQLSVETKLKELVGHTPFQVAAGFILGIITAISYWS